MFLKKLLIDFRMFLQRGSALDMAIGVITGAAMSGVVNSFVRDILTPPLGLLIGGINFHEIKIPIGYEANINIGEFFNALIGFGITMLAIFMVLRIANRLRHRVMATRECPDCKMSIPKEATRCPYCTSKIKPLQ